MLLLNMKNNAAASRYIVLRIIEVNMKQTCSAGLLNIDLYRRDESMECCALIHKKHNIHWDRLKYDFYRHFYLVFVYGTLYNCVFQNLTFTVVLDTND